MQILSLVCSGLEDKSFKKKTSKFCARNKNKWPNIWLIQVFLGRRKPYGISLCHPNAVCKNMLFIMCELTIIEVDLGAITGLFKSLHGNLGKHFTAIHFTITPSLLLS